MNFSNVLILAPHTDDGEIGAGGFVARLIESGAAVQYLAFSACEDSVPLGFERDVLRKEVLVATKCLGISSEDVKVLDFPVRNFNVHRQEILEELIRVRKKTNFDLVLTPSSFDLHQDHKVIYEESIRAFKNTTMLGYELIWNNLEVNNRCFVGLSESNLKCKIDAISQYDSQSGRAYVSAEFVRSLAVMRGVQTNKRFAESYEVIRWHLN